MSELVTARVIRAGIALSNVAYNLKQSSRSPLRDSDRASLESAQLEWDASLTESRSTASPVLEQEASTPRQKIVLLVLTELERAYAKHGREPWSRHEFYAILLEEVEEAWAEIKGDGSAEELTKEIVQVAAMCIRFLETGDRNDKQKTKGSP